MKHATPTSIKPLTSIRGLAAFWVYMYHCKFSTATDPLFKQFVISGYFGVDIFFILSGFIITYIHRDDFLTWKHVKAYLPRFLVLRLSRIYPVHLVTLLALAALIHLPFYGDCDTATNSNFFLNLLLVQSWGFFDNLSWNDVAWSISIEWLLYLSFPFLAWGIAVRAKGDTTSNLLLIALSFILWLTYFYASGAFMTHMHRPGVSVPRGLLDFLIGIALCNLYRLKFLKKLPWDALAVLSLLGFLANIQYRAGFVPDQDAIHYDMTMLLLSALAVYSFANIRGFGHTLFSNRPVVYLGTISYSFYMWHFIYTVLMPRLVPQWFSHPDFLSWQFALMTAGLIGLASLSFYFIENPARKLARQWVSTTKELRPMKTSTILFGAVAVTAVLAYAVATRHHNGAEYAASTADIQQADLVKAEKADPVTQYNLGVTFYQKKDYVQAAKWYGKAADQGNVHAYYGLGNLYNNGQGVTKNPTTANEWYRKGAVRGNADSQFALGLGYLHGGSLAQDYNQAYYWLLLATSAGQTNATTDRDEAAAHLTPQEIDDVKQRVQNFKAQ